jgi:tetratricopeptide (TPR) repeat protein
MSQKIQTFARRLMRLTEQQTRSEDLSAIFGSFGASPKGLQPKTTYRIGLWSCLYEPQPELAMGLWSALAYLLESWNGVRVYRLFTAFADDQETLDWSIEQTQITVEDWAVDSLDENIAIWGEITKDDSGYTLIVTIENDILTGVDNPPDELTFHQPYAYQFFAALPDIANHIADKIGASRRKDVIPIYDTAPADAHDLIDFCEKLVKWDVRLIASLWDIEWEDDLIEADLDALISAGQSLDGDFGGWAVANAIGQTMVPGYSVIGDLLVDRIDDVVQAFSDNHIPVAVLAQSMYSMGYTNEAITLLRDKAQTHQTADIIWLTLGDLHGRSGRILEAIAAFQTAVDHQATSAILYRTYGTALRLADQNGEMIEVFKLIDEDDIDDADAILWEAVEAYDAALDIDPDDIVTRHLQLSELVFLEADEDYFWEKFEQLLERDIEGYYLRDVIEDMYEIEDITRGIKAIETKIADEGERYDLYINLASLHLAHDEGDEARPYLEKAKAQISVSDVETLADLERLLLVADDPYFDRHFADLEAVIMAGNSPSTGDVEYLEQVSEDAPHLIDAHILLARAYVIWDDGDAALDVLLDIHERLPKSPIVIELLATIFWKAQEKELAFQYLNQGLETFPFYVPLIVQTGRYLFDNGQLDDARAFLTRAEEIAPRDPVLRDTRTYIANQMAQYPERYE